MTIVSSGINVYHNFKLFVCNSRTNDKLSCLKPCQMKLELSIEPVNCNSCFCAKSFYHIINAQ